MWWLITPLQSVQLYVFHYFVNEVQIASSQKLKWQFTANKKCYYIYFIDILEFCRDLSARRETHQTVGNLILHTLVII